MLKLSKFVVTCALSSISLVILSGCTTQKLETTVPTPTPMVVSPVPSASPSPTLSPSPTPKASPKPSSVSAPLEQRLLQATLEETCASVSTGTSMTNGELMASAKKTEAKYGVTQMQLSEYGNKLFNDPAYAAQKQQMIAERQRCQK